MKRIYKIEYDYKATVAVEIDHAVLTDELLNEINGFWSNDDYRLECAGGSVLKAVLRMLARTALAEQMANGNALYIFTEEPPEGWPKLDGSYGIRFISCEDLEIDDDDMTITCDGVNF